MARTAEVEERVGKLVENFGTYVAAYDELFPFSTTQRNAHRHTIEYRRAAGGVRAALSDQGFVLSLHRTLMAWGMGSRASHLLPEKEFFRALQVAASAIAAPDWQGDQRRTFRRVYDQLVKVARRTNPERYVTGEGWRTSRSKVLDNAIIGFCKVELNGHVRAATEQGERVSFSVPGLPLAKSEALSMLGAGHPHAPRVRMLLETARRAIVEQGFAPIEVGRVALDLVVHNLPGQLISDATNFLGGIGDVLEDKASRGVMSHLGDLAGVWLYRNDRQIKELTYREVGAKHLSYAVTLRNLGA